MKEKIKPDYLTLPIGSLLYLIVVYFTLGLRSDHIFFVAMINSLYFASDLTRRFVIAFWVFLFYWVLYDSMKAFPNYNFAHVDIQGIYSLEKKLFGITDGNSILTPNEYLLKHATTFGDLITAACYLCWIPAPLLFLFYLYPNHKNLFLRFSFGFFTVNFIGFIIYYIHPAAPPWYVHEYGFTFNPAAKGSAAGLLKADAHLGIHLFEGIYSKSSNTFAAMPSLHSSYPLIGFFYALKQKNNFIKLFFLILMPGIWFSAVYLSHHYILDVLAGVTCGVTGLALLEGFLLKKTFVKVFLKKLEDRISPPAA